MSVEMANVSKMETREGVLRAEEGKHEGVHLIYKKHDEIEGVVVV